MPAAALRLFGLTLLTHLALMCAATVADEDEGGDDFYKNRIRPILKAHCLDCHGAETQESDLRLDQLDADLSRGENAETWYDVLNKLNLGEMPPEDEKPLPNAARDTLVDWITERIRVAARTKRSASGAVRLRRLTRYEYSNTMRDLLGIQLDYANNLPPEPSSEDGFKNNAAVLGMSPLQMELYLNAARRGLSKAIVVGPQPEVVRHRVEKSEQARRKKLPASNRLDREARFLMRLEEFPREGVVLVRIRASAVVPEDAPLPRMRVTLGVRADVRAPEKDLGEADVKPNESQTFEFLGRIEEFPLPGHNPKFPGLQVSIYNQFDDAGEPKNKKKKSKKQKRQQKDQSEPQPQPADDPLIVIESVEFIGPVYSSWPPASHTRILFPERDSFEDESSYAAEVIRKFVARAYRRPPNDDDVALLMRLYEDLRPKYPSLEETMREVLAIALISPDFLYLVEPRGLGETREPLSDFELAARLSYFLWSSMPDEVLFQLAARGKLSDADVLAEQVDRMLADARSREFVRRFADQWLDLPAVDRVAVNPEFHPNFDDRLKADMRTESQLLLAAVLDQDLSALTLLDADFALLNRRLAKHYGLSGPRGLEFQRVALRPEDRRGGLLAQGSFLLANSNGEDSHPIKRAVWLLDRLLDMPPSPPPPDVPELDPKQKDLVGLSLKQQLEAHRTKPACNSCHRRIDPWGIAFENYDAVGRWRERVLQPSQGQAKKDSAHAAAKLDASATLPDGAKVSGVEEMKQYLLGKQRRRFAGALVKRLLTYSLGRTLEWSDQPQVESLTDSFAAGDYRLRSLLVAIVQSDTFRAK